MRHLYAEYNPGQSEEKQLEKDKVAQPAHNHLLVASDTGRHLQRWQAGLPAVLNAGKGCWQALGHAVCLGSCHELRQARNLHKGNHGHKTMQDNMSWYQLGSGRAHLNQDNSYFEPSSA